MRASGGLFQHDVRICSANPERVHASTSWAFVGNPIGFLCGDGKRAVVKIDGWIWFLKPQRRRDRFVFERKRRLHEAGNSGSGIRVADVGFHAADFAKTGFVGGFLKGMCQGRDFDRIAEICACAVAFDIVNRVGCDIRHSMCLGYGCRLSINGWGQIPRLVRPVIVDGRAFDNRPNVIAVAQCILDPAQHHDTHAAAKNGALGAMVKGVAVPVGGQNFALLKDISAPMGQFDSDTARQRHVAFAVLKRLAGVVGRNQRR